MKSGTGRKRGKNNSGSLGTKGMEMKDFKISKAACAPQSRPALDGLSRGDKRLPSGLCFQKSLHTRQITDDGGEERLIPINSQSVINIWASSV